MNSIEIRNKAMCTGCSACRNICPMQCIEMRADEEGFLYPWVDSTVCIECGICHEHCPMSTRQEIQEENICVYAAWSRNEQTRIESTSGGIFSELATEILKRGGYIVGAKYNEKHLVEHTIISDIIKLPELRQSKYIQSDMTTIFKEIKGLLNKGSLMLFVGTPCQCVGLTTYLEKTYDNLYLCDFICRGVNSPLVYQQYLSEFSEKYGSKVSRVWFKNKKQGWNHFGTQIEFENGQCYFADRDTDDFMYGYIKKGLNLYMRPSCGECQFKGFSRNTDFTLGDFWGIKLHELDDSLEQGVSMVMLHSSKAKKLWDAIGTNIHCEEHTLEEVIPFNNCLVNPAKPGEMRDDFWKSIKTAPFLDVMKKIKSQ